MRRRIGAAFKLDESLVLRGADPLGALERDLALQMQIARAAHRLCREENISKQLRRRRKTAALKEEQKLKALEDTLLAERRAMSAGGAGGAQELSASDESSLSDAALLEEGKGCGYGGRIPPLPTATLRLSCRGGTADGSRHPAAPSIPVPVAPFGLRGAE